MIDYDSFSRCHLTDIFFRFSRGSKRVKFLSKHSNFRLPLGLTRGIFCRDTALRRHIKGLTKR